VKVAEKVAERRGRFVLPFSLRRLRRGCGGGPATDAVDLTRFAGDGEVRSVLGIRFKGKRVASEDVVKERDEVMSTAREVEGVKIEFPVFADGLGTSLVDGGDVRSPERANR
jgi:hypothetical protein